MTDNSLALCRLVIVRFDTSKSQGILDVEVTTVDVPYAGRFVLGRPKPGLLLQWSPSSFSPKVESTSLNGLRMRTIDPTWCGICMVFGF